MTSEHTFKLLLAENKKKKRGDEPGAGDDGNKPSTKRRATKPKAKGEA